MMLRWRFHPTNVELSKLVNDMAGTKLEIANRLGVQERTLYRWLSGDTKAPKIAVNMAKVLAKKAG